MSELGVESDLAISGQLLDSPSLTEEMFKALLPHIKIYARMAPEQKERVLTGYKDQGKQHRYVSGDSARCQRLTE